MENVVHKIYHLTFPCSNTYVGSTSQILKERYSRYRSTAKYHPENPICRISTNYKFKEVKMVEVDRIECPMFDSKIKMLEEKWIKKLTPTLNTKKAYRSSEETKAAKRLHNHTNREYLNKYKIAYNKTPPGKLNILISTAKSNIKRHTKLNRPDMVLKWEGILEERIQNRLIYQSN